MLHCSPAAHLANEGSPATIGASEKGIPDAGRRIPAIANRSAQRSHVRFGKISTTLRHAFSSSCHLKHRNLAIANHLPTADNLPFFWRLI